MLKAPLRTAVVLLCLYFTCCSEQGDIAVKERVVPVDTAGVSKLVDTAYLLLRDTQVTESMSYMLRAFDIYCGAKLGSTGHKVVQSVVVEASKYGNLSPIYDFLNVAIQHTVDKPQTDTIAAKIQYLKGYFLQKEGRVNEANLCYEVTLQKLSPERFALIWLILLNNISQNYNSIGDYKKGEEYATQVLEFINRYSSKLDVKNITLEKTKALRAIGWALYEQQKNEEALIYFREALKTTSNEKKYDILTFISKCHLNTYRFDSAFSNVYSAIDLSKRFPEDIEINPAVDAVHQLARCHLEAGNLKEAIRFFYQELPDAKKEYGSRHPDCYKIMVYIGQIYQRLGEDDHALNSFQEAIRMSMPDSIPEAIKRNPGEAQLTAENWLLNALEGKTQIFYSRFTAEKSEENIQKTLEALRLTLAVKNQLFDLFETDTSKNNIQKANLHWYEKGIELSLISGDTTRAATFMQDAKAALLRERISQSAALNDIPDSLIVQHKMLRAQIAVLESALQRKESVSQKLLLSFRMQMDRLEKRMVSLSDAYGKISANASNISLDSLQNHLPDKTALLDFFYGERAVYILALCKNNRRVFTLNNVSVVKKNVQDLRNSLNTNAENEATQIFITAACSIYNELLRAPLDFIQHCDPMVHRLWVVPDGPLHYLPFNTLLTTDVASWSGKNMPFLIRKYAIGYAFTADQFFQKNSPHKGLSTYAGWGIKYDSLTLSTINHTGRLFTTAMRDFGPLPKAPEEIKNVAGTLDGKLWLNSQATKENFIRNAGNFQIDHLAMHAIADETSPQQSRLVFTANPATTGTTDHFLYATDIYGLTIPADMVVLSACNTANGELQRGEGIASIGRAFQFAGARSVLMTQWSIADNTAAMILPDFFNLLRQGLPKDVALQKAQLAMLERSSIQTPADWAGFIISGDINPIVIKMSFAPYLWIFLGIAVALVVVFFLRKAKHAVN